MTYLPSFKLRRQNQAKETIYIINEIGQSNMLGPYQNVGWDGFPEAYKVFIPNASIVYAYNTLPEGTTQYTLDGLRDSVSYRYRHIGPQYSLAKKYTEYSGRKVLVIHYAFGSTGLRPGSSNPDWHPDTVAGYYAGFISRLTDMINQVIAQGKIPRILTTIAEWGEQDAQTVPYPTSGSFYALLQYFFITKFRNEPSLIPYFVQANTNIQLYKLGTWASTGNASYQANRLIVRADQQQFSADFPNIGIVETEDLPSIVGDDIHRTSAAEVTIGERLFENIKDLPA